MMDINIILHYAIQKTNNQNKEKQLVSNTYIKDLLCTNSAF